MLLQESLTWNIALPEITVLKSRVVINSFCGLLSIIAIIAQPSNQLTHQNFFQLEEENELLVSSFLKKWLTWWLSQRTHGRKFCIAELLIGS